MGVIKKSVMLFLFLLLSLTFSRVDALEVSKNEVSIVKGKSESISLSTNVSEEVSSIDFSLIFSTYDIPAKFTVKEGYTSTIGGISNKITLDAPKSGKIDLGTIDISVVASPIQKIGYINLTNVKATTSNGNTVSLNSQTITVNVLDEAVAENDEKENTPTQTSNKTILESIDSDIVNIKIKKDVYEYNVSVSEDVLELDLKPVLTDNSYKVDVSSQKIDSLKDGKITITLSKDSEKIIYTVKVKVNKSIEIDESESPKYSYKGKWIIVIAILVLVLISGFYIKRKQKLY